MMHSYTYKIREVEDVAVYYWGSSGNIVARIQHRLKDLAAVINGEGRGEPYTGQVAIGAVVLNRVESDKFPNTIAEVVYQSGAFDSVRDGQINLIPTESALRAAMDAINGWDPTDGSLYFWNPSTATSKWIWSIPIKMQIGRHVFG